MSRVAGGCLMYPAAHPHSGRLSAIEASRADRVGERVVTRAGPGGGTPDRLSALSALKCIQAVRRVRLCLKPG